MNVQDVYRTLVMSMAMANQFKALNKVEIEWPKIMLQISFAFSFFSFNFNFVRPECSAKVDFWRTWMGFALFIYLMEIPFWTSYMCTVKLAMPHANKYQKMLLQNAFLRTLCQAQLILLPMHFEKIFSPFVCDPQIVGPPLLREQPSVKCDDTDPEYYIIIRAGKVMLVMVGFLFKFLHWSLKKSYAWQFGNQVRAGIPFYVGLMGLATEGHKGFVDGIREGILLCQIATGAFMSVPALVKRREKVSVIDEQARVEGENIYGEVGETPAGGEEVVADADQPVSDEDTVSELSRFIKDVKQGGGKVCGFTRKEGGGEGLWWRGDEGMRRGWEGVRRGEKRRERGGAAPVSRRR